MTRLDRRAFLKGAAATASLAALGNASPADAMVNLALPAAGDPVPARTKINHVVVLMQENRSVDHYFGWLGPELAAKGGPTFKSALNRTYFDSAAAAHSTADWGGGGRQDWCGCDFNDPGHGWNSGRTQLPDTDAGGLPGEPDGWLKDGSGNDEFAVSFYRPEDIPVTAEAARTFTTFDNYFCSVLTSTYPNREYMHSAQSGGINNNAFPPQVGYTDGFPWPTIWTLLEEAGVTWGYYYSNLPVIALWGARHLKGARHVSNFYADAAAGLLPQVSFVDPYFTLEGLANDDHPHADIRLGQEFLSGVIQAVMESPHWTDAARAPALFINYDEWGGFWDHVRPPVVSDPRGSDWGQLGFRTPTLLLSPYAKGKRGTRVDHGLYDHTSILKFIERNWALPTLFSRDKGARDRHDRNIGRAFNFDRFDPAVDPARYEYSAPPTARIPCELKGHAPPASDLAVLLENGWFDTFGFRTDWSFEDSFRR